MADPAAVEATREEVTKRLKASGEFDRMRAMIVASALESFQKDDADTFKPSVELTEAKAASTVPFQVVADWLRALGLNYTFNVLALEAGIDKKELDVKRKDLVAKVPGTEESTAENTVLNQLLSKPASNGHAAAQESPKKPAEAPAAQPAAKPEPSAAQPAAKPAIDLHPLTKNAVPKAGKKPMMISDTKYEIYCFDSGEFTRINEIHGQPLQLAELRNCKVYCYDSVDNVTIDECEDCEIVIAASEGSIFLRDSKNIKMTCACKQLRTRDAHDCDIRLYAMTDPVVEASSKVLIRPFNARLPNLNETFKRSKLDPEVNRFVHIYDFTPDRADLAKPHFTVQHPNHGLAIEDYGAEHGPLECPQAILDVFHDKRKPSESSEAGPNKSHNIKTGASAWSGGVTTSNPAPAPAATTAAPAKAADPAPKPAASKPAGGLLTRDSDSAKFSDYSDDDDDGFESSVKDDDDDDDEF